MKTKMDRLLELEASRTPGAWKVGRDNLGAYIMGVTYGSGTVLTDDAEWIAVCSELVPKILDLYKAAKLTGTLEGVLEFANAQKALDDFLKEEAVPLP